MCLPEDHEVIADGLNSRLEVDNKTGSTNENIVKYDAVYNLSL